jgi:hypothetical protein
MSNKCIFPQYTFLKHSFQAPTNIAPYILDGSWYFILRSFSVTGKYNIDDGVISEWWWIEKDLVGSRRGLILRYYPNIRLEGLRKTTKISLTIAGRQGQDFNPGSPEREAGVLTTLPRRSVVIFYIGHDVFALYISQLLISSSYFVFIFRSNTFSLMLWRLNRCR